MLWLLVVVLVLVWAGGYYRGPAPVRGNNLFHLLLVIVLVLVVWQLMGGTSLHRLRLR
jgi:hypothetical protein